MFSGEKGIKEEVVAAAGPKCVKAFVALEDGRTIGLDDVGVNFAWGLF